MGLYERNPLTTDLQLQKSGHKHKQALGGTAAMFCREKHVLFLGKDKSMEFLSELQEKRSGVTEWS